MSAANTAKPHRPCTELERAYIIQVLLHSQTSLDPSEVFSPSQATYANLPPLPGRYASLVLPYDWHLPGKEKRRKRKHRKSHGAIGFHELSAMIVDAWKDVDGDVKTYCKIVCAAGMAHYRAAMKEWKRKGGQPTKPQNKASPKVVAKIAGDGLAAQDPEKIKSIKDEVVVADASGGEDALQTLRDEIDFQNIAQGEARLPSTAVSEAITVGEINREFENNFPPLACDEPMAPQRTSAFTTDAVLSENAILQGSGGLKKGRNSSIVLVDMDDKEIFAMWNNEDTVSRQYGNDCKVVSCTANDRKPDLQFHSSFGSNDYKQTMQGMQWKKELMDLEAKIAMMQRMNGCPRPKRRTSVACSA